MKIDVEKIKLYIKMSGMTNIAIAKKIGISKPTLYKWLSAGNIYNESSIRKIAETINAPVNEISDLQPDAPLSKLNLSESANSIYELSGINNNSNDNFNDSREIIKHVLQMESKLNNASIIIKGILTSMDSLLYIKDKNLKYIVANKAFLKNIALMENFNTLGKTDFDFFPKAEAEANEKEDKHVLETCQSIKHKENFLLGSRKKRWGIYSKLPIFDKKNKVVGVLGIISDISYRKKTARISELLEINLNAMSEGIIIYAMDTHDYLYANKEALKIRNATSLEQVIKMDFYHFIHPDDVHIMEKIHKERNWKDIIRVRRLVSGNYRWFEYSYSESVFMGDKCIISIQKDINETVKSESHQLLLYNILNSMPKTILYIVEENERDEFKCTYISNNIKKITGYTKSEFLKKNKPLRSIVPAKEGILLERYISSKQEYGDFIHKIIKSDSSEILCHTTICSFNLNNIRHSVISITEITEDKKQAEELNNCRQTEFEKILKNKLFNIAKNLKNKNIDISVISESTGLTLQEITQL
ncbi:MAG TPA: PAS domain-containing protein [Victivallales bacterium]|nr:PAS domain-containing protein [Victivallales bacterium]